MAKKEKYKPEQLWDSLVPFIDISCSKCNKTSTGPNMDEYEACSHFFRLGWKATPNNIYCPDCAKKYLKK